MNKVQKLGLASIPMVLAGQAMAAVPEEVTTALATSKTDVGTVAAAVLLISVAILAFRYIRRAF